MFTVRGRAVTALALFVASVGCASTIVKKDPGPHTRGVRYYRPKPYLLIQPTFGDKVVSVTNDLDPSGKVLVQKTTVVKTSGKVRMSLEWLPDFAEEYAIQVRTGIGKNTTKINLTDGWRLDSIDVKLDSQATECVKALANLIGTEPKLFGGAVGGKAGVGPEPAPQVDLDTKPLEVYAHEVPLGYYESVLGRGPDGRRRLYGWRYVGFAPFANCPLDMSGAACQPCEATDLYGLVMVGNRLYFRTLNDLAADAKPITLINDQRTKTAPAPAPASTPLPTQAPVPGGGAAPGP